MQIRALPTILSDPDLEWYERISPLKDIDRDINEVLRFMKHLESNYQLVNFPISDLSPIDDEEGPDFLPRFYGSFDGIHAAFVYQFLCQLLVEESTNNEIRYSYYEKLKKISWDLIKRIEDFSSKDKGKAIFEYNLFHFLDKLISTGIALEDISSVIKGYNKLLNNIDLFQPYKVKDHVLFRNDMLIVSLENLINPIIQEKDSYSKIIFRHPMMIKAFTDAIAYAFDDEPCLIIGETGTGKEPIARCIHAFSRRKGKTLKTVNCGGFTNELFNAEMQGYVKGAFTGAISSRQGVFLSASSGTVFLDEINSLPIHSQAVLLRIIQFGEVQRVGDEGRTLKTDVRVICATNTEPLDLMKNGKFREDLYFRIAKGIIRVPALRDLSDSFEGIVDSFIEQQYSKKKLRKKIEVKATAIKMLKEYNWPGNFRELENVLYRGLKRMEINNENILKPSHIEELINTDGEKKHNKRDYSDINYKDLMEEYLTYYHRRTKGSVQKTVEETGLSRATIERKWKEYDIFYQ
jgi:transcriptional regulator with PAS, ATPase and Fis domain